MSTLYYIPKSNQRYIYLITFVISPLHRTEDGNFHPIEIDVSDTGTVWRRERVSIESGSAWRLVLEAYVNDGGDALAVGTVNIDDVAFHSDCPA